MTAVDYGLRRAPIEVPAALRMADEILSTFAKYLDESGCPLTVEQRAAMDLAHGEIARQEAS